MVSLVEFLNSVASKIPNKWKLVAIALHLPMDTINDIDQKHFGEPRQCFPEVFIFWQRNVVPQSLVNWTTIIDVLRSDLVHENHLAATIQALYIGNVNALGNVY